MNINLINKIYLILNTNILWFVIKIKSQKDLWLRFHIHM